MTMPTFWKKFMIGLFAVPPILFIILAVAFGKDSPSTNLFVGLVGGFWIDVVLLNIAISVFLFWLFWTLVYKLWLALDRIINQPQLPTNQQVEE